MYRKCITDHNWQEVDTTIPEQAAALDFYWHYKATMGSTDCLLFACHPKGPLRHLISSRGLVMLTDSTSYCMQLARLLLRVNTAPSTLPSINTDTFTRCDIKVEDAKTELITALAAVDVLDFDPLKDPLWNVRCALSGHYKKPFDLSTAAQTLLDHICDMVNPLAA